MAEPQLWVKVGVGAWQSLSPDRVWRFGTGNGCEIALDDAGQDRVWLTLRRVGAWTLRTGSGVVVHLDGKLVEAERSYSIDPDRVTHVSAGVGTVGVGITLSPFPPASEPFGGRSVVVTDGAMAAGPGVLVDDPGRVVTLNDGEKVTLGRAGRGANIELPGDDLAGHHADLTWMGDHLQVVDRSRGLGVHVRGEAVLLVRLTPGESFVVGHHVVEVGVRQIVITPLRAVEFALVASDLTARYRESRPGALAVDHLNFALPDGAFLALIGPSGVGKSSLCRVLLGELVDVDGSLRFRDVELSRAHALWHLISHVPQAESMAMELTVAESLTYVARMRLAGDLGHAGRRERVAKVLDDVELTEHQHKLVANLSGGQRRRVSIAMELLSDPQLLILDEPTSGLDEGLDRRMLELLRDYAARGTTVVLVTHSTANLELCDAVLAVCRGGRLGYFGGPAGVLPSFGRSTWADVMNDLRDGVQAQPAPATSAPPGTDQRVAGRRARRRGVALPMLARELARAGRRRGWLLGNLLAPVFVALLAQAAGGTLDPSARGPAELGVLAALATCAAFAATQTTFSSIVADRAMILREARWGLAVGSVVASRAIVACALSTYQAVVASVLFLLMGDLPPESLVAAPAVVLVVSMVLLSLASCCLGLWVSSTARTLEQATFTLMGISVVQAVLNGIAITIGSRDGAKELLFWLSTLVPARWGVSGVASSYGIKSADNDPLWRHEDQWVYLAWGSLTALAVFFLVATVLQLRKVVDTRL